MDDNGVTAEESAMDIDIPGESNGSTAGEKENGLVLYPVEQYGSGEGLPYAPVDWPNPGDCWRWKVGKRMSNSGHFVDRYLYVPDRLQETKRKRRGFASKLSVAQYIQEKYPGSDVQAFFATFSWKIPGKKSTEGLAGSGAGSPIFIVSSEERSEHLGSDSQSGGVGCKAGNEACPSLEEIENSSSNVMMPCDVCCSEPRFCRECCCILCCKTVSYSYGSYSFIKCEAVVEDNYMCGHIAHVDCALRTYMAGTVGGSIGLDAEYYCRRCDARTDLVPHVTRLLKTCESISSRTNVENILNVGFRVLRNSEKSSAKRLFRRIGFAMEKLKTGASLDEIWRAEDVPTVTTGLFHNGEDTPEVPKHRELLELESLKLDAEIAQVLRALKKAQESEYKIAEERLHAQKDYIMHLHEQLDQDRSEISRRSSSDQDELFEAIMDRLDRVKMETQRLRDMKEVAKGFGKTSKDILKDYFDLETDSCYREADDGGVDSFIRLSKQSHWLWVIDVFSDSVSHPISAFVDSLLAGASPFQSLIGLLIRQRRKTMDNSRSTDGEKDNRFVLYRIKQHRSGPPIFGVPSEKRLEHLGSDSQNGGVGCKAGNQACPSLEEIGNSSSKVMPCDVCCTEPRFCRECRCILCCKTVSYSYGNYSFIKCETVVKGNYICGHIAHVECALRTYMAGTVGGSIGLDAEYYCRRCDARTDLVPHVTRLLKTCESVSSRTTVENILNVGFRVLRNSEKSSAKRLFRRIGFALEKLKTGTSLDEIWRAEDMPTVTEGPPIFGVPSDKRLEHLGSDSQNGGVGCKAGNQACPSLEEIGNSSSKVMPCDVCCSEPRFCRECLCILCCKTVSYSYGNYSFIKCEAVVKGNYICGHIAHVECALRAYMAGTVGGSTGLDAEYYCRRCDARTDLVPHVTRLLKTCESISSRTNVENILDVGFRVLRNSEKSSAKRVFRRIGFALEKLKTGTSLDEIWRAEDMSTVTEDCVEAAPNRRGFLELEALKLETEIEEVLQALKKAQECEYKTAEEKLHAQKHCILCMRQQLDKDRSELSRGICSNPDWLFESLMDRSEFSGDIYSNPDWLFEALMVRLDRLKTETEKLRDMKEVAKGFGRTSKDILKNYFDVQTD